MALPVRDFIIQRLLEYDPSFDVGAGVPTTSLLIDPLTVILQPVIDELSVVQLSQSILSILETDNPDVFPEDIVDGLASNAFVERNPGSLGSDIQRIRFFQPEEFGAQRGILVFRGPAGQRYTNSEAVSITTAEMSLNQDGTLYYVDIPIIAIEEGADFNVEAGSITTMESEPTGAANTSNLFGIQQGRDRETNTELIDRIKIAVTVRALVTGRGIIVTLTENFTTIEEITPVGFGDAEMMRDIVYNVHIGGNVDVYIKTPSFTVGSHDVFNLEVDTTRQKAANATATLFVLGQAYTMSRSPVDRTNVSPIVKSLDGAIIYAEGPSADYTIDDVTGSIARVAGSAIVHLDVTSAAIGGTDSPAASVSAFAAGIATFTGLVGMVANDVGKVLEVSGADSAGNNGQFVIDSFVSDSSVNVANASGVAGDANNGSITANVIRSNKTITKAGAFADAKAGMRVTIDTFPVVGVYSIKEKVDDDNVIIYGGFAVSPIASGVDLKVDEVVAISFEYNPVTIDVISEVRDASRNLYTITDVPLMLIDSVQLLDPLSGEPTGVLLDSIGGYGQGGYGLGGYGVGAGADYKLVVVEPTLRHSEREDNYIEFSSANVGLSVRVNYQHASAIPPIQSFMDDRDEQSQSASLIARHYIPVYVDSTQAIIYDINAADETGAISTADMLVLVKDFIDDVVANADLQASDIIDVLYDNGAVRVDLGTIQSLRGEIHNHNGSIIFTIPTSDGSIAIPNDPIPDPTDKPLSSRIARFRSRNVTLARNVV